MNAHVARYKNTETPLAVLHDTFSSKMRVSPQYAFLAYQNDLHKNLNN